MKRLVINSGEGLAVRLHYHVVSIGLLHREQQRSRLVDAVQMLHSNESVFIPMTTKYGLQNPGRCRSL